MFAILIAFAALPAWGMESSDKLTVIAYSAATPEQRRDASTLMIKEFCKVLGNPLEQINLLLDGDAVKGALVYRDATFNDKKARNIEYLAIDETCRRKHHGRFLTQKTEDAAQKLDIQLITAQAKPSAVGFYTKLGFIPNENTSRLMYKLLGKKQ